LNPSYKLDPVDLLARCPLHLKYLPASTREVGFSLQN
jgi:hypothetical protein